jgi:hypothetical protein
MKKTRAAISLLLVLSFSLLFSAFASAAAAPASVTATPTSSTVYVNDTAVTFQAYNIGGSNYFKLRDLAVTLGVTEKNFSLEWDGNANAIYIMTNGYYVPQGDEMTVTGDKSPVKAVPNTSDVYVNGKQVNLTAYRIGGYNYFRLRDVGVALDFGVTYDGTANTIKINTAQRYYVGGLMDLLQDSYHRARYDEASGVFSYTGMDTGSLRVTRVTASSYTVAAENISSEHDFAILKNVIGLFTESPDKVMDALQASKNEGVKDLSLDNKTFSCLYLGQSQTVKISW